MNPLKMFNQCFLMYEVDCEAGCDRWERQLTVLAIKNRQKCYEMYPDSRDECDRAYDFVTNVILRDMLEDCKRTCREFWSGENPGGPYPPYPPLPPPMGED